MMNLLDALNKINDFKGFWLAVKLASIETDFRGCDKESAVSLLSNYNIESPLLEAALTLKEAAAQIDEVIHSVGILQVLPHILEPDEVIESLSLGAGNTGKEFDLITNLRIAEFKFIFWRGGPESIRQNQLFKDFFKLAEWDTNKKRYLYVLDSSIPMKFLNGGRSIRSVLSRNTKLWDLFQRDYGARFTRVKEYYNYRKDKVEIVDLMKFTEQQV